ncbi:glycine N-phenylacetyltransferase-like [Cavia porcellus]|uniref:glycine N-phenylacetyltransferase-like n=1 Tax=Cavia porcellus TaxID=10141 RepID=UPI002FE35F5A
MLQMLEKYLVEHMPESIKVYGTIFHMNHGNPFKVKALVDKWPDFNTVVVLPQEQEMNDDLDHYPKTYQIFSKEPKNCQEFLDKPDDINWKQHLQIQSKESGVAQSSLNEVIQSVAAAKLVKVKKTQCILYMMPMTVKKLVPSLLGTQHLKSESPRIVNQEMFKLSLLDVAHAALVNKFWGFGGNERSQRFIERCIRTFPTFCLLGPEKTPVTWVLMDYTGELRVGATVPEYHGLGLGSYLSHIQIQTLENGFPLYCHTAKDNKAVHKISLKLNYVTVPCDWNQWNCMPLSSCLSTQESVGGL